MINSMYFEGLETCMEFIKTLCNLSLDDSGLYNDIHLYEEEGAFIVEWVQIPYNHEYGGEFKFVDDDECVMLEREFPDRHYEYFSSEDDYKETLSKWLKENPQWERTPWGTWTNKEELIDIEKS